MDIVELGRRMNELPMCNETKGKLVKVSGKSKFVEKERNQVFEKCLVTEHMIRRET